MILFPTRKPTIFFGYSSNGFHFGGVGEIVVLPLAESDGDVLDAEDVGDLHR